MKHYWVVQFLAEDKHAWDIAKDIRLMFAGKVHSVNCVPHLEDLDGDAIDAPPEREHKPQATGKHKAETSEKPQNHTFAKGLPIGRRAPKGGQMRHILTSEMRKAGGPVLQRHFYSVVKQSGMSEGNIVRTLYRMESVGECKHHQTKGGLAWELIENGIEKDQAA